MKIPVLPISYADAQPLLETLKDRSRPNLARRTADHVSHWSGTGDGSPEGRYRLDDEAVLQRDRHHPRLASFRTNG